MERLHKGVLLPEINLAVLPGTVQYGINIILVMIRRAPSTLETSRAKKRQNDSLGTRME